MMMHHTGFKMLDLVRAYHLAKLVNGIDVVGFWGSSC